eukprot:394917_1
MATGIGIMLSNILLCIHFCHGNVTNVTMPPTTHPTQDPTAEPCDFMVITSAHPEMTFVDRYSGVYNIQNLGSESWISVNATNAYSYLLFNENGMWKIAELEDWTGLVLQIPGVMHRPPYDATSWQFATDVHRMNWTLHIECSMTNAPTSDPTESPSMASEEPTYAPSMSPSDTPSMAPSYTPMSPSDAPSKDPTDATESPTIQDSSESTSYNVWIVVLAVIALCIFF